MTIRVGGLSRLLGTALLGMVVPWMACAGGSEDESLHAAPTVAPRQHSPAIIRERHGRNATSSHWSGYAITGANDSVTDLKGSWIVPTIAPGTCTSVTQYSSFWVGIDGYSSNTVEQIGTDSDCQNGEPVYYAWYEFYPKFPYNIPITINKDDVISAEVMYYGGKFTLVIEDGRQVNRGALRRRCPTRSGRRPSGSLRIAEGCFQTSAQWNSGKTIRPTRVLRAPVTLLWGTLADLSAPPLSPQALSKSPWSRATALL